MPTFLYRIQPTRSEMLSDGPTEDEAGIIAEHFEYLTALTKSGQVLMAGRTLTDDEASFGVVVFTADTPEQAKALAQADPAVIKGVMTHELFPFRVALWSDTGPEPMV